MVHRIIHTIIWNIYECILILNGWTTWPFNDVFCKKPSGLTSILYDKMAIPFASPSATALYCFFHSTTFVNCDFTTSICLIYYDLLFELTMNIHQR